MEELFTRFTDRSKLPSSAEPTTGYGLSVDRKNQVVSIVGRLVGYILSAILGPSQVIRKLMHSATATLLQTCTATPSSYSEPTIEIFSRFKGEPPDTPALISTGLLTHHSKKASIISVQHPMNEQIILTRLIRRESVQARVNTSEGAWPLRQNALSRSSFTELLSSFIYASHKALLPVSKGSCLLLTLLLLWLASSPSLAQTSTINLKLHNLISNQAPKVGDVVTYTIVVSNSLGSATATTVAVKEELPNGGVAYVTGSASIVRGNGTYTPDGSTLSGIWNIASIAPGDSAVLTLQATVQQQGVWFNKAEVISADQTDLNSTPNNQSLTEDDYEAVCFSVPIVWYPGDEYTITIPSGYDGIIWYRNDVPISSSAVSTSLAEVNSDFSLTIKSTGTYRFATYRAGCPTTNCCDIQIIQGAYGSLGDLVFADTNKDGIRQTDEPGIPNVVVVLLDGANTPIASTTTSASGIYSFTGLTPGVPYSVSFVTPAGYTPTLARVGGDDTKDSDADPVTGKTRSVTLSPGENNLNLDAGFYPSCSGDFNLTVSDDMTICNGDKAVLVASTTASYVRLYLTPSGGTAFDTLHLGQQSSTVYPTVSTIYYAEAVTQDGSCVSARKPISVSVTALPTPTIVANATSTCPAKTVDLTTIAIGNSTSGLTYEWYTSLNRSSSTKVTNLTAVGAGQYYLFAKSGDCYSQAALLTVGILDCNCQTLVGVSVGAGQNACAADPISLQATLSGAATSVIWTSSGTGTFGNPTSLTTTYTPSTADITAGSVVLTATTNDPDGSSGTCQPATSSLLATINARPAAPTALASSDSPLCLGSSTKLTALAPGSQINWYDAQGQIIGTTPSGGNLVVTPTNVGGVVYTAEAFTQAGCVSARSSLSLTVSACLADLALVKTVVTPGPYQVGQTVTYALQASNKGPVTASGVTVTDRLPASLSYVSTTPAGAYNPATGTWTLGTLPVGEERTLFVETTITTAGTIKNAGLIAGLNNDPALYQNDTSSVTIPVNTCLTNPPIILCAITQICKGGTTTLSAKGCTDGTVRWSDGRTGLTIFSTPTTTTIYTASCVSGSCVSAASNAITVVVLEPQVPIITASADVVCPGTSLTLTASGCQGGVIEWSDQARTGPSIVVTPFSKTIYTAQCRQGSCLSNPATKMIDMTTQVPAPTIVSSTSVVCPGEALTLTVAGCVGTPVWNSTTATTTSIVVTPTLGNNTYSVYCKNQACVSPSSPIYTVGIVSPVIPTVTASADTICTKGTVTLTAADCNGTVVWNVAGQTGPSITVSPAASISYYAQCRYRTCLSAPSNTVAITVVTPTAPIISVSSTTLCSGTKLTLTAKGCAGTVHWAGLTQVGASLELYPTATADYYATCQQGACQSEASNKVRVTVRSSSASAPVVTASTQAVCSGGVVSLSATGCTGGTVRWSDGQVGTVVSVTATPTNHEFYALCQAEGQCGTGKSNLLTLTVTPTSTPSIVRCLCSADTICPGEVVKLSVKNCQGVPYWSTGDTTKSISVSPMVSTVYSVYCQGGMCRSASSQPYTITVIPVAAPTITASATVVAPGGTVSLSASGCAGTVIWSANDVSGNNRGATLVVKPEGTQTYYAQCQFRQCLSNPSTTIVINPGDCSAKAGTLVAVSPTVCAGSSTTVAIGASLNGGLVQPTGYSVLYVLTKGAEKLVQQTSSTPRFIVSSTAAAYTIHTLVYNANTTDKNYLDLSAIKMGISTATDVLQLIGTKCASLDATGANVQVHAVNPPTLSANSSLTACAGGVVSLSATGCSGGMVTWSDGTVGAIYTKLIDRALTLTATCTVDGCSSTQSASVRIIVDTPVVPTIVGNATSVCLGEVVSLTATGCESGSYRWSDGRTTGNTLTVTPTADVRYRVKCKVGECEGDWSAYTTVKVGAPTAPTISIVGSNASTTICLGSPVTLTAQGCSPTSSVTWSNNQEGTSIIVSPVSSMSLTARCGSPTQCQSAPSNAITLTVLPKVVSPTVVDKTNACPSVTVNLATAVTSNVTTTGGVFEYYTDASLSLASKVTTPTAVGTGTYYVVERTVSGCTSIPVAIHVQITICQDPTACDSQNPATANAGTDATICSGQSYTLSGTMGGAAKTAHWTSSGSGSFDNAYALKAAYTPSSEDILAGKVTLTLSVSTNNAACPVATDNMILSIDGIKSIPVITIVGGTKLCFGDSVTLKAPAGASGYKWSNQATSQSITVKSSGTYTVQLLDAKGCNSAPSTSVSISVADPVATPIVKNLRNECPAKIVDLTKALSTTTTGSSYTYRICACNSSNIVMRPDSVCEGTYWIVERNAAGCLSAPAKVVVKVFDCASDTLTADVRITKLASTTLVKNGAPVTYTLTVSNGGPHTAYNIDVRDVLPKGLELLPVSTATYRVSNGVITRRIDSLKTGQSTSIVFAARITQKGATVVNKAEITYLDNPDTNLANNSSSVTVRDSSNRQASQIGLAKAVLGQPILVGDSLIRVSYNFLLTNFGEDTLRSVQITDDLAYAFSPNHIQSAKVSLSTGSTLKANGSFTGKVPDFQLLDTLSRLLPGASQTFRLDVTVKRTAGDTTMTFKNIANATAINSLTMVADRSVNGGDSDPDHDGDPTNNAGFSSFTLNPQAKGPSIGLALTVIRVEPQPDSSYTVTYKATLKNFGAVDLKGIVLTDSLVRVFTAPASYSVVGTPVIGAGSTLVVNSAFNGNTQPTILSPASQLAAGVQDTVLIRVNIKPNGNMGPFYSSATVVGHTTDSSQVVSDISNNGLDPAPAGSVSTTVRFDLPKGLLGVAKSVGTPTLVQTGVYDIPYTIILTNMGVVPLKKLQVVDNLSQTFGHGALIVSNQLSVTSTGGLVVNPSYSGQGQATNMLVDSLSTLAVGAKSQLYFTVRVDVTKADSLIFYNEAQAVALTPTGESVSDRSTTGTNNDPDNDLDPRNNSSPTPVVLNGLSSSAYLGLALSVRDTVRQVDGSYNVTYQLVVKNYGSERITKVSISDTLSTIFNSQSGSRYQVVRAPFATSSGSALKLNSDYNGDSDPLLVLGDSSSVLAAGKVDTLQWIINVSANGSTTTFLNSAYASGFAPSGAVSDVSTSGLNPDLNGNGNPTDSNEREATALNLPVVYQSLFIPEGFSPNGDGINDLFVIRGAAGLTVSLDVYNRWGHLVYQNADYRNDWDGKSNQGISVGSAADGVPDGTYYYVINTSDGRKFVRYMTINR